MVSASVSVTINEPTLFGSSVILSDGTSKYDAFETLFGDVEIARTYSGLNKDPTQYTSKYAGLDVSHGMASATSIKYNPADVLSGAKDGTLVNFFAQFKPGKVRWWTYWHEPDGEIYGSPQVYTAADYRAAFAHVNAIAQANVPGGVDARPFLCVEEYSMRPANAKGPATARPFASFYPGDFIQAIGFDVYSGWNESSPYTLTPSAQFDKLFTIGQQYGKPLCFPELGSSATAPSGVTMTRAQWMTNALRYIRPHADEIAWITWWCDQFADISTDTAAATIWKNMCLNGWAGTP
jgi:hypothetical protein